MPRFIAQITQADLDQIEESRRRIEESRKLLQEPFWPDHRVPSTIEILFDAPPLRDDEPNST